MHIIPSTYTLLEAIRKLDLLSGSSMTLIITDEANRPIGTLTDGDVRRALIANVSLSDSVTKAMHCDFKSLSEKDLSVPNLRQLRKKGIFLLPVTDINGRLVRTIDLRYTKALLPVSALIMAGGKGERLRPMTLSTPKPLLQIEGKAIIDYAVESLASVGIDDITVSTSYLSEQLDAHFAEPVANVAVKTERETEPRGTIGALALLLPKIKHNHVLVMNSDLITDIAFDEMYERHIANGNDITVAALPYTVSVPYAILSTDGETVTSLEEKPTYSLYANAGIYLISRRAATLVPATGRYDATDLIADAISNNLTVGYYPINGTWIDVGTPADFRHACDILKYNHHSANDD